MKFRFSRQCYHFINRPFIANEHKHLVLGLEFEDVNSLETVTFYTPWHTTLTAAWDEAARLLEEPRKPDDRLQSHAGTDLMPYLALTLRELIDRKIVKALRFQIVGPTGGADVDFW